jgi:Tfp pilus assembly protein PilN
MTVTTSTDQVAAESGVLAGGFGLLPRVNLLPPEIAERAAFRKVQGMLGAAVLAVLVLIGLVVMSASRGVTSAEEELAASQSETTRLKKQQASYANVGAIYAAADAAQAQLVTAMGDELRFSQLLTDLSLSIPSSVWVGNVSLATSAPATSLSGKPTVGTFTVSGIGFSHEDVALWLEAVANLKTYADPYFSSSSEALLGKRVIVNFSSTASITPAALSGRYTNQAGG